MTRMCEWHECFSIYSVVASNIVDKPSVPYVTLGVAKSLP
jgi:hypothetical protein